MTHPPIDAFGRLTPGGRRSFTDTLRAENTGAILLAIGTVLVQLRTSAAGVMAWLPAGRGR